MATWTSYTINNQPCNSVQFSRRLRRTLIIKPLVHRTVIDSFFAPRVIITILTVNTCVRWRIFCSRDANNICDQLSKKFVDLKSGSSNKFPRKKTFLLVAFAQWLIRKENEIVLEIARHRMHVLYIHRRLNV